jgi:hypothetical protein
VGLAAFPIAIGALKSFAGEGAVERAAPQRVATITWVEHQLGRAPTTLAAPKMTFGAEQAAELSFDDASCRIDLAVRSIAGTSPARHTIEVRVVEKQGDRAVWMAPKLTLADGHEGYLSIPKPDGSGIQLWVKINLAP